MLVIIMRTRSLLCTAVIALLLLPFGSAWSFVKAQATPTIHFENPNNIFTTSVASVGTTFNLSVLVDNAPDYGGVEVYMGFNDSIVNATRWFEPTWNSSYILYGLASSTLPAPPNTGYHHIGLNRGQIQIAVNKGGLPPVAPWAHSGLAMIIEFNITAVPTVGGDKFTTGLGINYPDTFLLDPTGATISPVDIQDGYYEISKSGGPPPSGFTLTIVSSAGGSTNPAPGDHSYDKGASASVQANPDVGHHLDHWELDSVNVGSVNPYSVTMDKNRTLNAFFLINNYTLTITASSGGTTNPVQGNYSYTYGTSVSVNATADVKYVFDHWELDAVKVGSADPYLVTMNDNHTLKAVFVLVGQGLKGDVNGDGKVDGKDIFYALVAFGSYGPDALYPGSPQHPRWNPLCDLNKDGKVNLMDFFIICMNFGKTKA